MEQEPPHTSLGESQNWNLIVTDLQINVCCNGNEGQHKVDHANNLMVGEAITSEEEQGKVPEGGSVPEVWRLRIARSTLPA